MDIGISAFFSPWHLLPCCCCCLLTESCPTLLQPPRTSALQAPLSLGFPRQEYWSGLPFPPPGDIPDAGVEPVSPAWQVGSLPLSHLEAPTPI